MMKQEYRIDLKGVRSARTLHTRLAAALPFPEGNFDALFDFLTEYGSEMKIVFANSSAAPATLKRVCTDAMEETPGLEIVFE